MHFSSVSEYSGYSMEMEDWDVAIHIQIQGAIILENTPEHCQGLLHMGAVEVGQGPLPGPGPGLNIEDGLDLGGVQDAVMLLWRKQSFSWRLT